MDAHRASLRTRDTAAERGIAGAHRDLHVTEVLRRLADRLEQTHRRIMFIVKLLEIAGRGESRTWKIENGGRKVTIATDWDPVGADR